MSGSRRTQNSNPPVRPRGKLEPSDAQGRGAPKIRTLLVPSTKNSNPLPPRKTRALYSPGSRRTQNSNPPVRPHRKFDPSDAQGPGAPKIRTLLVPGMENLNPLTSRVAVHPKLQPSYPCGQPSQNRMYLRPAPGDVLVLNLEKEIYKKIR